MNFKRVSKATQPLTDDRNLIFEKERQTRRRQFFSATGICSLATFTRGHTLTRGFLGFLACRCRFDSERSLKCDLQKGRKPKSDPRRCLRENHCWQWRLWKNQMLRTLSNKFICCYPQSLWLHSNLQGFLLLASLNFFKDPIYDCIGVHVPYINDDKKKNQYVREVYTALKRAHSVLPKDCEKDRSFRRVSRLWAFWCLF